MRPLGFSTGALARGDFAQGLALQKEGAVLAAELDGEVVPRISAYLVANDVADFPYLGGEELNTSPTHSHHRYVAPSRPAAFGGARAAFVPTGLADHSMKARVQSSFRKALPRR